MWLCEETKHFRCLLDLNQQLYSHILRSGKAFSVNMCSSPRTCPWLCRESNVVHLLPPCCLSASILSISLHTIAADYLVAKVHSGLWPRAFIWLPNILLGNTVHFPKSHSTGSNTAPSNILSKLLNFEENLEYFSSGLQS